MGFFDTFKVMKDIVTGGIASFKAGEKLDDLSEQAINDYEDVLTDAEKSLYKQYKNSAQAYSDNTDTDKNDALTKKMEDDRQTFLESLQKNSSLPKSFRNEIQNALTEFAKAENLAVDSLGETLEKYAENDEQRAEIRRTVEQERKK